MYSLLNVFGNLHGTSQQMCLDVRSLCGVSLDINAANVSDIQISTFTMGHGIFRPLKAHQSEPMPLTFVELSPILSRGDVDDHCGCDVVSTI